MPTDAPSGLATDIAAITRVLLNLDAPADLQQAARTTLTPPPTITPLHPVPTQPAAVPAQVAAFTPARTIPTPTTPAHAAAAWQTSPAADTDLLAAIDTTVDAPTPPAETPTDDSDVDTGTAAGSDPQPETPQATQPAAPSYLDDREAARSVLEQLSFLDD